eukprot:TRINITY_DN100811_c0_g1_i1.p1 TRINITY_DN100811_c0_g1~~TRINITY_DN100811_c0_g1_i1.p1  ORF type:complete len:235 (+),score=27.84 TRINITY_DN100811_c0_g1_i1:158-862(+)
MAAGITVPYSREGYETRHLVERSWPLRQNEREPDALAFSTTSAHYGVHVPSNAARHYQPPEKTAGSGKRQGAYYQATGCLSNRVEEGFKNTLGHCGLTEVPVQEYGTMRRTGSYVLHPQNNATVPGHMSTVLPPRHTSGRSTRAPSERSRRSEGGMSMRSRSSSASSIPSWAKRNATQRQEPWNFETLPMYQRTNESYGQAPNFRDMTTMRSAGRSDTGFIAPNDLVAALTQKP